MRWSRVTDADLVHVQALTKLHELRLFSTQIADAGLFHLRGLKRLEYLSLSETQVTDAGLTYLRELTNLEDLYLDQTQVTDAGLAHLRGLVTLRSLTLEETRVTDAGLVHLRELRGLVLVYLHGTKVTETGVKELQAALPKTYVRWPQAEVIRHLREDADFAAEYLKAALEDSHDPKVLLLTLRRLTEARGGFAKVAHAAGIERESLHRALSARGNPRLSTLVAVLHAIGLKLTVEAA